jgi:hypothetical protein
VEAPPILGNGSGLPIGEDLALETVRLFRESVAVGDLSLALALLDRDASLVEVIPGESSEQVTRGELLLELRRRHAEGLHLELLESRITLPAEGVALVLSRLAVLQSGPDGYGEEVGRVDETVVLLVTPDGWRIRHLHRSLRPEA